MVGIFLFFSIRWFGVLESSFFCYRCMCRMGWRGAVIVFFGGFLFIEEEGMGFYFRLNSSGRVGC